MNKYLKIGITMMVALMLVFSYTAKAEFSFKQMVAGMVAEMYYSDFKAEVDDEEVTLGKASGYANMQHVSFLQGLSVGGRDQVSWGNDGALDTALLLYSSATSTDLTEGAVYYDSDDKLMKLWDGGRWSPVATTTSGSGFFTVSGDRVQMTRLATDYMAFGTTTAATNGLMILEATSTTAIPLTLRGYNAQTANLFQIHNVAGTELFAVDFQGNASSTLALTVGGAFYVSGASIFDGALSISTTTVPNAMVTVEASSTTAIPLTIRGYASQASDFFQIQDAGSTDLLAVNSAGDLVVDTDTLFVDVSADAVGISSSTPTSMLSIGTKSATSTIMMGAFCMFAEDEAGTGVYIKIDLSSSNVFSTSTSACN